MINAEALHDCGKNQGCLLESCDPRIEADNRFCRILVEHIVDFLDVNWGDRSIVQKLLYTHLVQILIQGREGLLEQFLHTQLDIIADTFNQTFDLQDMTQEEREKINKDYQDTIKKDGKIGVNYSHATHAKLNSIIEAIKIKHGINPPKVYKED